MDVRIEEVIYIIIKFWSEKSFPSRNSAFYQWGKRNQRLWRRKYL